MLLNNFVVALEGNPGAGKTTIKNNVTLRGYDIERIDQILPDNPDSDIELTAADIIASDLLKSSKIQKYQNKLIILDRYVDSTLAYQYAYDHCNGTSNYGILRNAYNSLTSLGYLVKPDLTIYIDVRSNISISRKNRENEKTYWTNNLFLNKMREYYDTHAAVDHIVDGNDSYKLVHEKIVKIIMEATEDSAKK